MSEREMLQMALQALDNSEPQVGALRLYHDAAESIREHFAVEQDARRYRWWRDNACREPGKVAKMLGPLVFCQEIDEAIDAELASEAALPA